MKLKKVDKKQFQKLVKHFENSVKKYQKMFNLLNYRISIFEQIKPGVRASCYHDNEGRVASICYSLEWLHENPSLNDIEETAFHEVIELLLSKLRDYSIDLNIQRTTEDVNQEVHNIIRILENILIRKMR